LSTQGQGYICCKTLLGPNGYFLQAIPVTQSQSRGSASYALTIERRMERLVMNLAISRAIQPSGFGALLTQDDVSLMASIPWTYRLTLAATLHGSRISDPLHQLVLYGQRYADFDLSANWLWTEHWTLQLQGTYLVRRLISAGPTASSTSVYLNLLRQFGRIRL
jgi:hypothetical protein